MPRVLLGLGSSLDPLIHLAQARQALTLRFGPLKASRVYQSAPYHHLDQPPYSNQVLSLQTRRDPLEVLDQILEIERSLGRVRGERRWENRSLDIDILDYAGQVLDSSRLTLPHYDLAGRDFFLLPLAEVEPDYIHPRSQKNLATLIAEIPPQLQTQATPFHEDRNDSLL